MAFQTQIQQPNFAGAAQLIEKADPFSALGKTMTELDGLIENRRSEDYIKGLDPTQIKTTEGLYSAMQASPNDIAREKLKKDLTTVAALDKSRMDTQKNQLDMLNKQATMAKTLSDMNIAKQKEQRAQQEHSQQGPVKLSDQESDNVTKAYEGAQKALGEEAQWTRMREMADNIDQAGASNWLKEQLKSTFGMEDAATDTRQFFTQLVNQQVIASLPAGPATDKDIEVIRAGFPGPNASKEQVKRFATAMINLKQHQAMVLQAKADWTQNNKNLGRANRDMIINGRKIKKGSSYLDYTKALSKEKYDKKAAEEKAISDAKIAKQKAIDEQNAKTKAAIEAKYKQEQEVAKTKSLDIASQMKSATEGQVITNNNGQQIQKINGKWVFVNGQQ